MYVGESEEETLSSSDIDGVEGDDLSDGEILMQEGIVERSGAPPPQEEDDDDF